MKSIGAVLIVAILAIAIAAAFIFRWFEISTSTDNSSDKANVEFTVDKGKVKEDTAHVVAEVKKLGHKVSDSVQPEPKDGDDFKDPNGTRLSLELKEINLDEGAQKDVTITRTGGEHRELQLALSPSSGSKLLATEGHFMVGETSTHISVTAPIGAQNGSISIVTGGQSEVLTVHVNR